MQVIIVVLILLIAVCYALWRTVGTLKGKNNPCDGCEMKKNCQKFCQFK
jgi:hypothetical protein